jgi:hypothetical protein
MTLQANDLIGTIEHGVREIAYVAGGNYYISVGNFVDHDLVFTLFPVQIGTAIHVTEKDGHFFLQHGQ